jgi:hypothetical protein
MKLSKCVFSICLLEMARKGSKGKKTMRKGKQCGGGWGFTGAGSIPGTPGTTSNPMVYTGIGDCRAVKPGYDIPYSQYGASFKGLPGMSGGKRTRKGMRKQRTRKQRGGSTAATSQRGGRYGFAPEMDPNAHGQAWWAGSYAPIQRIGCEGGSFNPLNPTHTPSSAPAGAASPNYWMAKGGAQTMAPATYGVGNVDSMYYYAPTGGYANTASTWKDSVGAPVQIQVPYAARAMNQACLTTGGSPPLTGALQKGGKRKGTKRGRKQRGGDWKNTLGLTALTSQLPSWLGGPSAETSVVPTSSESNPLSANNVYKAINVAGLRRSKNENKFVKAMSSAAEVPPQAMPAPQAQMPKTTTTNLPPLPLSPPGSVPPLPLSPPEGGRRHKKSRKHRKQRKH